MKYLIKGFMIENGNLDCRFKCELNSFDDVIEFMSRVNIFENFDVVHIVNELKGE